MKKLLPNHWQIKLLMLAGLGLIMLLWVRAGWPCVFRRLTGLPCISCGMSRAWLAALRLDLPAALGYHPMFWSVPILVVYALYDGRLFPGRRLNFWFGTALIAGLIVCYAIRLAAYLGGRLVL